MTASAPPNTLPNRTGPNRTGPPLLLRVTAVLILAAVAAHLAAFFYVTTQRVAYPFELEWMEGALVDHTARIMAGEDLFTAPSVEHISYLYTPLYYYLSALVASFTGLGFLPLRLVALLASLGCALTLGLIVRRESPSIGWLPGIVAGGMFLAGFWIVDGWHDLARNDSLFLLLLLVSVWLLRGDTDRRAVLAGVIVVLAFLAKQLTLVLLPALAIGTAALSFRRAVLFTVSTSVCLITTVGLYTWLSEGWFFFFIFELPSHHASATGIQFWSWDMRPLWISLVIGAIWLATGLGRSERRRSLFFACIAAGLLVATHTARHHSGGHINALMPWLVGGGLLTGLAMQRAAGQNLAVQLSLSAALLAQFGCLVETGKSFLPRPEHRRESIRFHDYLRSIEGEVFVPCHGHVAAAAGHQRSMHAMAMHDLQTSQTDPVELLLQSLGAAYAERRYQLVVINEPHSSTFLGGGKTIPGYRRVATPPFDHQALRPLHGMTTTPALVFERID